MAPRGDAGVGGPGGYIANAQHLVSQIALALAISFGWFLVSASIALLARTAFAFAHQTARATALGADLQSTASEIVMAERRPRDRVDL
jgi:hypothetical protein